MVRSGKSARIAEKVGLSPPTVLERMRDGAVGLVINTPSGPVARVDEIRIRSEAILRGIPIVTTESGARSTLAAILYMRDHDWGVRALQEYTGA